MATIAIVGLLIALLLPAVQSARESARRTTCGSNLKQIGLSLASREATMKAFPSGGLASPSGRFGHSWMVDILPYLDQLPLYDKLDLIGRNRNPQLSNSPDTGLVYGTNSWSSDPGNAYNGQLLAGVSLPMYACPSSGLPMWALQDRAPPGPLGVLAPSYTAISGAIDHSSKVVDEAPAFDWQAAGIRSRGGVLIMFRSVTPAAIVDGLSNTMLVGEQSDWCVTSSGQTIDCRSQRGLGFSMGPQPESTTDNRFFNGTTVRWPINSRAWNQPGVGVASGINTPILSAHPGGAHGLMADGRVQFLQETLELQTLFDLCNRNDRRVVSGAF